MPNTNSIVIVGTLTREVELKHIPSGTALAELSIAHNRRFKKGDEWVEDTDYYDIKLWGRQAESLANTAGKGDPVIIQGRLEMEKWEDKQSGTMRSRLKIVANSVQRLTWPEEANTIPEQARKTRVEQGETADDELPF